MWFGVWKANWNISDRAAIIISYLRLHADFFAVILDTIADKIYMGTRSVTKVANLNLALGPQNLVHMKLAFG